MQNVMETSQAPVKYRVPGNTWIQIMFTVDPDLYRAIRTWAEKEGRTVPSLVRLRMIDLF